MPKTPCDPLELKVIARTQHLRALVCRDAQAWPAEGVCEDGGGVGDLVVSQALRHSCEQGVVQCQQSLVALPPLPALSHSLITEMLEGEGLKPEDATATG